MSHETSRNHEIATLRNQHLRNQIAKVILSKLPRKFSSMAISDVRLVLDLDSLSRRPEFQTPEFKKLYNAWFFAKLLALIGAFIWIRGTLPRLRMDQLMNLAWQYILPMALINMLVAGIWHFMSAGPLRWLVCTALLAAPCVLLSLALKRKKRLQVRTYYFAE